MVKKRVSTAVQFCFCDAAFVDLGNRCNDTSKTSLGSNVTFVFVRFYLLYRSPFVV